MNRQPTKNKKQHKIHKNNILKLKHKQYKPNHTDTPFKYCPPTSSHLLPTNNFSTSLIDMKEALLQQQKMFDQMLGHSAITYNEDSQVSLDIFNLQKQEGLPLPDNFEQSCPIFTNSKEMENAVQTQKVISVEYQDYLTYIIV